MKIHRILVPIDYSPGSADALESAADLAERLGAEIDVVHVVDVPGGQPARELESFVAPLERGSHGPRVHVRIEHGDPPAVIARLAEEEGYDLIVMGTHGRTGFRRAIVGSVAEEVVRSSRVPVLTVRIDAPPARVSQARASTRPRRRP